MTTGARQRKIGASALRRRWTFQKPAGVETCIVKAGDPFWRTCETLEYEVFTDPETGFYEVNDEGRIVEFDSFGRQEFVAALVGDEVVGVLRLMYSDQPTMREGLFQTFDHRSELRIIPEMELCLASLDPRKTVDFSSTAVVRKARRTRALQAIFTRTILRIWETERRFGLACVDTPLYRKYKARALDFRDLGPSTFYWGSPTTAAIIDTYSIPKGKDRLLIPLCRVKGLLERGGLVRNP